MLPDPYNPQALNRYAYALNNPVKYTDPSGHYVETAVDVAFIAMDLNDIRTGNADKWTYIGLAADVVCLALPVATGGRVAVMAVEEGVIHADKVGDLFKFLDKTADAKKGDNLGDSLHTSNYFIEYGHDFGKLGTYVKNPGLKVDWSKTTLHGAERMKERGVSSEMVETWVKDGKALSQDNGNRYAFVTTEGVAVVSNDGKLITAWTKDTYDNQMKNVVNKLYGEE
jgi:pyocin large subunit-like protein